MASYKVLEDQIKKKPLYMDFLNLITTVLMGIPSPESAVLHNVGFVWFWFSLVTPTNVLCVSALLSHGI